MLDPESRIQETALAISAAGVADPIPCQLGPVMPAADLTLQGTSLQQRRETTEAHALTRNQSPVSNSRRRRRLSLDDCSVHCLLQWGYPTSSRGTLTCARGENEN